MTSLTLSNLREAQVTIHAWNMKWWTDKFGVPLERNRGELISLMHSELAEATTGIMTGRLDDHLEWRMNEEVEMADTAIRILDYSEGFEYDLGRAFKVMADNGLAVVFHDVSSKLAQIAQIHLSLGNVTEAERKGNYDKAEASLAITLKLIIMYCELWGWNLEGAIRDKCKYNLQRADHKHEAREQIDGKKW